MKRFFLFFPVISLLFLLNACQQSHKITPNDWPQFKKDNYRGGVTPVAIFDKTFGLKWEYKAPQVPAPAWYGPAREDAYALSGPLPSMRDYDLAYSPIIVGDKWYYGSSSDDAVHCLNTKTGKEEWIFITNGPVRIAPTYYEGKLYFGSDDGHVYCINASNGELKWKFSPSKSRQRLLNNGRLISFWPVRTGVMIEDGIAYFGASLIPWKKSWLCGLDAKTGKVKGEGTYVRKVENVTFEGSMASSGKRLIQPQGRISPVFIDRKTGKIEGQLPGAGGCFVLVTPDKHIVHPETSRFKEIVDLQVGKKNPDYMSFKGGKEMVVSGDKSYVLSDHAISAYNRKTKEVLWVNKTYHAHRIIMADTILFAGATDTVYAVSVTTGQPLWQGNVEGTIYAMAAGDSALFVSTGEGKVYCFARHGAKTSGEKNKPVSDWKEPPKKALSLLRFPLGPVINIRDKHHIAIDFVTTQPTQCTLYWHSNNNIEKAVFKDPAQAVKHHFEIPVRKDFIYYYWIEGNGKMTKSYEYNNFFNYSIPKINVPKNWFADKAINNYVDNLLKNTGTHKGLCLVLGMKSGQLPVELAQKTELDVIVLDKSRQKIDGFRKKLEREGVYGRRISAYMVQDYNHIPIQSNLADLVICNRNEYPADEVIRLTAPFGKAVYMKGKEKEKLAKYYMEQTRASNRLWQVTENMPKAGEYYMVILSKKEPKTDGVWIAEYGKPDNSAFGGENMWGTTSSEEFEIQWMGRPGPRFQADRNGRKPSPLAINGKLFVQGKERIAAIDAYNGTIVWTKWIPGFIRMNVVRDCSNWAADGKYIYAVKGGKLLVINQKDGSIREEVKVPGFATGKYDWGYVGTYVGTSGPGMVVGSAVPVHSAFVSFYGGWGWYDETHGPETDKVMSYNLFVIPAGGGKILWKYEHKPSMIINSTITIYDGKIFFVESATPKLSDKKRGRENIFHKISLVALDLKDGSLLWRKKLDNKPGVAAYYMAAGHDRLVIVSSLKGTYYIYNYDTQDGSLKWQNGMPWPSDNHGGHLSRPAIVGNRLMLKPGLFRMDNGKRLDYDVPKAGHGCASYALSEQSVFYRGGSITQFNFDTRKFSKWERLRPDCWISTVPALGMVLSPEGGGGCSCGNWYETSMVMAPKSRAPVMFQFNGDSRFIDTLQVSLILKKGVKGKLYFTSDGTEPDENATPYEKPIKLDENTEIRVALYVLKGGKEVKMTRSRYFERLRPAPQISPQNALPGGKRTILLNRIGNTGIIHYTLDGTSPNQKSPVFEDKIVIRKPTKVQAITIWKDKRGRIYKSQISHALVDIPKVMPAVKKTVHPGLVVKYYEGEWKQVPVFDSLQSLKTFVVSKINLDPAQKVEKFGLRFTGYIRVPKDGIYIFYLTSDDGSNLYVQGKKIIDNDGTHGAREKMGPIPLQAGLHPIRIEYFQTVTSEALSLQWEGPSFGKEKLPAVVLFH